MKKIMLTPILICLPLLCCCDRHLDQYPHNGISSELICEEDAQLLLTGAYNIAQYKPTFNGWALFDLIGGDIIRTGASGMNTPELLVTMGITPNQSIVVSPWNGFYAGLYQINVFIEKIGQLPQSQKKDEMLAAGHFFRGLYYYNITARWRNIPIVTSTIDTDVPQTPEEEAWIFVAEEFKEAIRLGSDFQDKNHVSHQAAKALLARTYLAMGMMKEAAQVAEEVIADGNFTLSDFNSIFRGGYNREEIFSFANLVQESSVNMSSYYYTKQSPVGGAYNFCPTQEAMDMYGPDDSRKSVSVDYQGSNPVLNKYCSGDAGHDPLYIVRLAEMYLISAEGQGYPEGLGRLNELRVHRGLSPAAPASEEEFLDAVLDERRLELFGEGFRWFDLVRTGRYEKTVSVDSRDTVLPIPARELTLNKRLKQHPLWDAASDNKN